MFFWSFPQPVSAEKLITIKGINIEMSLSQVIDVLKNKGFTSDPPCVAAGSAKDEHCLFWNNDPRAYIKWEKADESVSEAKRVASKISFLNTLSSKSFRVCGCRLLLV